MNPDEAIDELEADIAADDEQAPGYRAGLERLLPVMRLTMVLWQERERLGLSVEDVAARTGLLLEEVEAIDGNDVDAPVQSLARYAAAVGLRLDFVPLSA